MRVLIAEDDHHLRKIFLKTFTHFGYTVDLVENGQEALKMIKQSPPDVLVLDLGLPIVTGQEILEFLEDQSIYQSMKVILVSGNERAISGEIGKKADVALLKPVSIHDLIGVVKAF